MTQKRKLLYSLFAAAFGIFTLSFSGNPPNGRTGAPGDGLCSDCHSSGAGSIDGEILLTGLPATIDPNTTYTITVMVNNPNGLAQRAGFQWVALNSSNQNAGTMTVASSSSTVTPSGGRNYHEHSPAQNFGGGNSVSWTVNWTSPDAPASNETITFYGASVIANGNGSSSGDLVATTQVTGQMMGGGTPLSGNIVNPVDVSCNGESDGQATAQPAGGAPPYTYNWSSGSNAQTATNLSAGINTVTITDAGFNSTTADILIEEPDAISVNASLTEGIDCDTPQGSATVNATGGVGSYTFAWSNGGMGATNSNLPAGLNSVTVTDGNNCIEVGTINVPENTTLPTVDAGPDSVINCDLPSISLNASVSNCSNCQYSWSTTDGNILQGANTLNPEVNEAGTYVLTATNPDNACVESDELVVISDFTSPIADAGMPDTINCNQAEAILNGAASDCILCDYSWATTDGQIVSGADTTSLTVGSAGTYVLISINTSNGCSDQDSVMVIETIPPSATIVNMIDVSCNGGTDGSAQAQGAMGKPPYTFNWPSGGNMAVEENLEAGTYIVTITDSDGCTATASTVISEPSLLEPNVSAFDESASGAEDGIATAAPSGGNAPYSYLWSNGATTDSIFNLAPGLYTVTVTDANNCTASETISVTNFDCSLSVATSTTNVSCNGAADGMAAVNLSNEVGPVQFAWSNGATTDTISGLEAGSYQLTVTDGNNCTTTTSVVITQPSALNLMPTIENVSCNGAMDGAAMINVSGGVAPYMISWPFGGNGTNLSAGVYNVSVTDDNGCLETINVTITQPDVLAIEVVEAVPITCIDADGRLEVAATGGSEPYQYLWSDGTEGPVNETPQGVSSVMVEDANGCSSSLAVEVEENTVAPMIEIENDAFELNCSVETVMLAASIENCEECTIMWSTDEGDIIGSSTEASVVLGASGVYVLTVTSGINGCVSTDSVTVTNIPPLELSNLEVSPVSCSGAMDGTINFDFANGTMPFSFTWLPEGTDPEEGLSAGTYSVTIEDANGCIEMASFTVEEPDSIDISIVEVIQPGTGQSDGAINVDIEGGVGTFTFEWFLEGQLIANTEDVAGLAAGIYTLIVTDENGCIAMQEIVLDNLNSTALVQAVFEHWRLYPNPAQQKTTLEVDCSAPVGLQLQIYDYRGTMLLEEKLPKSSSHLRELDISTLPSGNYLLLLYAENNAQKVLPFTVKR
jgi:hypothetical protein